ncbi:MAG: hypothetical protein IJ981_01690 [Clostridia bacterium]|nr:hypothetical protein [Clostridia bacterium]MBR2874969.1 hypothetical protein [Clostridia bacterium]
MKKIRLLLTTLVLTFVMVFAVGCGIETDWNKATEKFVKKGYEVGLGTEYSDIRYTLSAFSLYVSPSNVDCILTADDEFEDELIFIFYCKDAATAEEIHERIDRNSSLIMGFAKTAGNSVSSDDVLYACDGSIFYIGTKKAIKIAK